MQELYWFLFLNNSFDLTYKENLNIVLGEEKEDWEDSESD